MNATETKQVITWYLEDIERSKATIEKIRSECTHFHVDGGKAWVSGECVACGLYVGTTLE